MRQDAGIAPLGRKVVRFISWIALCLGWLALAGCRSTQPVSTVAPTLALPTAPPTPTRVPTAAEPTPTAFATNFPIWRTVTLQVGQSFDFRQEKVGLPTEGDLYYSATNPLQGTACFWANNATQIGGRDLGSWPLTALTERPLPRNRLSGRCIAVIQGHVYVYGMRGDERVAVFRVADTGLDSVTLEYILRK